MAMNAAVQDEDEMKNRDGSVQATNLYELYICLGSDNGHSLRRAIAILDRKGLSAAEFLTDLLARDIQDFRRSQRQQAWLLLLTIAFLTLANGRLILGWSLQNETGLLFGLLSVLIMRCLTLHCIAHQTKRRRIRNLLFLLQEAPPIQRVNVFVDVMRYGDSDASCLAQAILVETLPHVKDQNVLSPGQHKILCQALRGTNSHLIVAILNAFEQIGTRRSHRAVRSLLSCPVWLADAQRIERAANSCHLAMQEREKRQATVQTSLRATMPIITTSAPAQTLLRPVENPPRNSYKSSPASIEPEPLVQFLSLQDSLHELRSP